jgi:hypothetical protein
LWVVAKNVPRPFQTVEWRALVTIRQASAGSLITAGRSAGRRAALTLLSLATFTVKSAQEPGGFPFLVWGGLCLAALVVGGITYALVRYLERAWKLRMRLATTIRVVLGTWLVVGLALGVSVLALYLNFK